MFEMEKIDRIVSAKEKRGLLIALFGDNAGKEHSSFLVKARYTDQIGKFYERGGGG